MEHLVTTKEKPIFCKVEKWGICYPTQYGVDEAVEYEGGGAGGILLVPGQRGQELSHHPAPLQQ